MSRHSSFFVTWLCIEEIFARGGSCSSCYTCMLLLFPSQCICVTLVALQVLVMIISSESPLRVVNIPHQETFVWYSIWKLVVCVCCCCFWLLLMDMFFFRSLNIIVFFKSYNHIIWITFFCCCLIDIGNKCRLGSRIDSRLSFNNTHISPRPWRIRLWLPCWRRPVACPNCRSSRSQSPES